MNKILLSSGLPEEPIKELKYLYIVVDSNYEVHYEFNNKGHIMLPIHKNEINPFNIYKNLPGNLIKKCTSDKKNIVGVLQLWIFYTKDYAYARVRGLGIIETFTGNKFKALLLLVKAMDTFCTGYNIKFVEAETSTIPHKVMERAGFKSIPSTQFIQRLMQKISRQVPYTKTYF